MARERRVGERSEVAKAAELAEHSVVFRKLLELFPFVRTISDAPQSMALVISAEDIAAAEPGNPALCAIAVNVARTVPRCRGGMIGRKFGFLVYEDGHATRHALSTETTINLRAFDLAQTADAKRAFPTGPLILSPVPPSSQLARMARRATLTKTFAKRRGNTKALSRRGKALRRQKDTARGEALKTEFRTWDRATLRTATPAAIPA